MRPSPRTAAIIAVALVALSMAGILLFGRIADPNFPSLAETPDNDIPGRIAWISWRGDEPCLWIVDASGGKARKLRCDRMLGGPPVWSNSGELQLIDNRMEFGTTLTIDPETGKVLRREQRDRDDARHIEPGRSGSDTRSDGTYVRTEAEGRTARLFVARPGDAEREVVAVRGRRDYGWWSAQWSPDGDYVLVQDSLQRLLIVRTSDGHIWHLADDAGEAAWGPSRPS